MATEIHKIVLIPIVVADLSLYGFDADIKIQLSTSQPEHYSTVQLNDEVVSWIMAPTETYLFTAINCLCNGKGLETMQCFGNGLCVFVGFNEQFSCNL